MPAPRSRRRCASWERGSRVGCTAASFGPGLGLWYRVGDGVIGKIVGSASRFAAERSGRLSVTCKPPGEFADRSGGFEAEPPRGELARAFEVAVLQWRGDAGAARDDERALLADCERAFASPALREVVGVWLIAVSAFQGGEGRCRYRGIALDDAAGRVVVHA